MGIDFRPRQNCRECKLKCLGVPVKCPTIKDTALAGNMTEIKSFSQYIKDVAIIKTPSNEQHISSPVVVSNYVQQTAELDSVFDHASLVNNNESIAKTKVSTPQDYTLPGYNFENRNWDDICGSINNKDRKIGRESWEEATSALSSGAINEADTASNGSGDAHHTHLNEDHKLICIYKRKRCSGCYNKLALKFGREIAQKQCNKTTSACCICNKHMCKRCFSLHIYNIKKIWNNQMMKQCNDLES